jgi:tetratricopeptide (TPR) repeat protein
MTREQLELIASELDDIRGALDWALANDAHLGLELAVALEEFWVIREPAEGRSWEERLLDAAPDAPLQLRAAGLRALGGARDISGEHELAAPCYRASLELFEALGDDAEAAFLRFRIGANAINRGENELGGPLVEASLTDFRRLGQPVREAQALSYLGWMAADEGDLDRALELTLASAETVRAIGWPWWQGGQLVTAAEFERRRGDHRQAARRAREALAIASDIGDRQFAIFAAAELASAAATLGDASTAGRMWGAIEREEAAGATGQWPPYRAEHEERVLQAAGTAFEEARAEGRLLTLAEAAALTVAYT